MAVSKKKKKKGVIEMDQEQLYTTACLDLEIISIITDMESKIKLYKRAIELLTKIITDYQEDTLLYKGETAKDGRELTEEEKELKAVQTANQKLAEIQKEYDLIVSQYLDQDFQDAMAKIENAETVADFESVIKQLENNRRMKKQNLPNRSTLSAKRWIKIRDEQKSIADTINSCKEKIAKLQKKEKTKQKIYIGLTIVIIAAILFSLTTSLPKLAKAKVWETLGLTAKARGNYEELDNTYGKPEYHEKYLKLSCERGKELLEEGDYKNAYEMIKIAVDEQFEGADELLYKVEMESVQNRDLGEAAHFGNHVWKILDRTENEVVLTTKVSVDTDVVFSEKGATWKESDLRAYLNSEFYENTFSELEKTDIMLSTVSAAGNSEYNIPAGDTTEDYVYVLSAEEVIQYSDYTKKQELPYWLRNPGAEDGLNSFAIGNVPMMYGYPSDNPTVAVYPVIRITLGSQK